MMRIFCGITVALAMAGCVAQSDKITLGEKENNTAIHLPSGACALVRLPANPTTGYRWKFESSDPAVLSILGEKFIRRDSNLVGAPGVVELELQAVKAGSAGLDGYYYRPWEKLDRGRDLKIHYRFLITPQRRDPACR